MKAFAMEHPILTFLIIGFVCDAVVEIVRILAG